MKLDETNKKITSLGLILCWLLLLVSGNMIIIRMNFLKLVFLGVIFHNLNCYVKKVNDTILELGIHAYFFSNCPYQLSDTMYYYTYSEKDEFQ